MVPLLITRSWGLAARHSVQSDFEIYQSGTVITGNVAEGPHSTLTHGIDATINGRWDYDLTDANPAAAGFTGTVTGGFHQIDLSGVSAAARAASTAAAAFVPTQTFASLDPFDGVGSIVGTPGVNVIQITGDSALKISLTLSGTSTSSFIFQFTSPTTAGHDILSLSGMTMNIGAINPDNIYWDFNGAGGDLFIKGMAVGQNSLRQFPGTGSKHYHATTPSSTDGSLAVEMAARSAFTPPQRLLAVPDPTQRS